MIVISFSQIILLIIALSFLLILIGIRDDDAENSIYFVFMGFLFGSISSMILLFYNINRIFSFISRIIRIVP